MFDILIDLFICVTHCYKNYTEYTSYKNIKGSNFSYFYLSLIFKIIKNGKKRPGDLSK